MNCCGGGIWQPNTNFLGSGKGFSCAPLMYNAWSVSSVWQEMSWNDPGVSSDQKRFTYFSLALNPFRIFWGKVSSGRGTQPDKLHLQAADHPAGQVKNPFIPFGTQLSWDMYCTAPRRILKVVYCYSSQSHAYRTTRDVVVFVMWQK